MPAAEVPSRYTIDALQAAAEARGAAQRSFARDGRGNPCVIDVWDAPARLVAGETLERAVGTTRDEWFVLRGPRREPLAPPARVFVHEDLSQRARELLPPQPVPWRQRLLWSAAFLLLRTRAGRAWLARRTGA